MFSIERRVGLENISNESELPSELVCTICTDLIVNPVKCKKCQNIYCKKCIMEWGQNSTSCPLCNEIFVEEPIDRLASNLILQCILQCVKCKKRVNYEQFHNHLCILQVESEIVDEINNLNISVQQQNTNLPNILKLKKKECKNCKKIEKMEIQYEAYPQFNYQWFCDECGNVKEKVNSLHCTNCEDYDFCFYCLSPTNDKENIIKLKIPDCPGEKCGKKRMKYTPLPYAYHSVYKGKWYCNKCQVRFNSKASIQCEKCEQDICLNCLEVQE